MGVLLFGYGLYNYYLTLNPLKGRSSFSRAGHGEMRKALYMPALVALKHNPLVKTFGERVKSAGLAPKAVVGACMHKLAMLIYGCVAQDSRLMSILRRKSLLFKTVSDP